MIDKVVGQSGKLLSGRVILVGVLPSAMLVGITAFLVAAGLPGRPPQFGRAIGVFAHLPAVAVAGLVGATVIGAMLTEPLTLAITQVFEGYWGTRGIVGSLRRKRTRHHQKRWDALLQAVTPPPDADESWGDRAEVHGALFELYNLFPSRESILSTRLGNVLRSAEERPHKRYGLDAVAFWPRLYPLLPERLTAIIDDARDQMDFALRIVTACLVTASLNLLLIAAQAGYFVDSSRAGHLLPLLWLLVPAGALLVAWLAYRGSVYAALQFGMGVQAAYDLHRFDLLEALHWKVPGNMDEEKGSNRLLSTFLLQDLAPGLNYHHPEKRSPAPATEPDGCARSPR